MKNRCKLFLLFLLLLIACCLLFLHNRYHISTEQILSWQPENLFLAAGILMLFYAVKSASVFIPIMIPQILADHLHTRDLALLINILGLLVVVSVPYGIGKTLGSAGMAELVREYPRIQTILNTQEENQMAFSFMFRVCAVPPADIVTMYAFLRSEDDLSFSQYSHPACH